MAKPRFTVTIYIDDPAIIDALDKLAGPQGRSAWIVDAIQQKLNATK